MIRDTYFSDNKIKLFCLMNTLQIWDSVAHADLTRRSPSLTQTLHVVFIGYTDPTRAGPSAGSSAVLVVCRGFVAITRTRINPNRSSCVVSGCAMKLRRSPCVFFDNSASPNSFVYGSELSADRARVGFWSESAMF